MSEQDNPAEGVTDLEEAAWGIIANVNPWEEQSKEWQAAVLRWRDKYHDKLIDGPANGRARYSCLCNPERSG